MQKKLDATEVIHWTNLLTRLTVNPMSIGVMLSSKVLSQQFLLSCKVSHLTCFSLPQHLSDPEIDQILREPGCDAIVCDQDHYHEVARILNQSEKPLTILLCEEEWTPDWCWRFEPHHFLCQQDLNRSH